MKSLEIGSFNIRCFGFGGEYDGKVGTEYRQNDLAQLIQSFFQNCHIICFQEICSVDELSNILPDEYDIFTYEHNYPRHQRIALALHSDFELQDSYGCQFRLDTLLLNPKTSRPALIGTLIHKKSGKQILDLIGLHLKSGAYHSDKRISQISFVVDHYKKNQPSRPILLLGDLNTQDSRKTKKHADDIFLLTEKLKEIGLNPVANERPTYLTPWETHKLDHIFHSPELSPTSPLKVLKLNFEENSSDKQKREVIQNYFEGISDHLPIKASFKISDES